MADLSDLTDTMEQHIRCFSEHYLILFK